MAHAFVEFIEKLRAADGPQNLIDLLIGDVLHAKTHIVGDRSFEEHGVLQDNPDVRAVGTFCIRCDIDTVDEDFPHIAVFEIIESQE